MTKEIKIDKVCFKIGKKEINLTLEEAKTLFEVLEKAFNYERRISYFYPSPIVIEKIKYPEPYRWREWEITWGQGTAGGTYTVDNQTQMSDTLYLSCSNASN